MKVWVSRPFKNKPENKLDRRLKQSRIGTEIDLKQKNMEK